MQTVTYTTLRQLALEQYGVTSDRSTAELQGRFRGLLSRRLSLIWQAEEWPEITFTEQRRFAPVYNDTVSYRNGDFVYYPTTSQYYQALPTAAFTGEDPVDTAGDLNTTYWAGAKSSLSGSDWVLGTSYVVGDEVYSRTDHRHYICIAATSSVDPAALGSTAYWSTLEVLRLRVPFVQTESPIALAVGTSHTSGVTTFATTASRLDVQVGEQVLVASVTPVGYNGSWPVVRRPGSTTVEATMSVDPGAYSTGGTIARAYRRIGEVFQVTDVDPRIDRGYQQFTPFYDELGVVLPSASAAVWIRHRQTVPRLLGAAWDATTTYAVGGQMLYTDGDFYEATAATSAAESPDTHPGKWSVVTIPQRFSNYLVHGAVADALRMDGQHDTANLQERVARDWLELETDNLYRQSGNYRPLEVKGY